MRGGRKQRKMKGVFRNQRENGMTKYSYKNEDENGK